jgi:acyl-CoA thioester hydrolase
VLDQEVRRGDERLFVARVVLVCMSMAGGAARVPADVRARLTAA